MRNNQVLISIAVIVAVLSLLGCAKQSQVTGPDEPTAPNLPSLNTMEMNLGLFESAQIDAQSVMQGRLTGPTIASASASKLNFLNAAVRVLFLDVVVYSALAQPVAAFATAIHSVPQYQEDGSWLWTYIYVDNGAEFSIFLTGKRLDTSVVWSMEVSSTDPNMPLDHFLWFDGEAQSDDRSGYWQFYEPDTGLALAAAATPGIPCIRIDWRNNSRIDRELALLVHKPGVDEEGTTLTFTETLEMGTIDFYDAASGDTGAIIWNRDGSGSIEWPDYKDGAKSCWDVQQFDVDCP